MYDIFFDLDDLHPMVDDLSDEYWGIGEVIDLESVEQLESSELIVQNPDYVVVARRHGGLNCKDCGEHFPYAESNQPDGSLICYSCRRF